MGNGGRPDVSVNAIRMIIELIAVIACFGISILSAWMADGLRLAFGRRYRERRARRLASPLQLRVESREEFSDELFSVTLRSPHRPVLPAYRPGQYVTVVIERENGAPLRRCYSLATWQKRPDRYELGIRRVAGGTMSSLLHQHLHPGTPIRVLPPRGDFTLRQNRCNVALIAGGIGITPLRAMLQALLNRGQYNKSTTVMLFHAARYANELCYRLEFQGLEGIYPRFRYLPIISRPTPSWNGLRGRLDARQICRHIDDPLNTDFYLCANPDMMIAVQEGLIKHGVSDRNIFTEAFGTGELLADDTTYRLSFEGYPPFLFHGLPTLLHGLEQAGIAIAGDCRSGHCGACRIRLEDGDCRWLLQPQQPLGDNEILACCAVPQSDLKLARIGTGH